MAPRILIAGGGVAGLEALLALRELAGPGPEVLILAPRPDYVERALAVAEPFGAGRRRPVPVAAAAEACGAALRLDAVAAVDVPARLVRCTSGAPESFDALAVAVGAARRPAFADGLTFGEDPQGRRSRPRGSRPSWPAPPGDAARPRAGAAAACGGTRGGVDHRPSPRPPPSARPAAPA